MSVVEHHLEAQKPFELQLFVWQELHVGSGFDPNQPMQRQQLLQKLQLRETASIKAALLPYFILFLRPFV